MTLSGGQNPRSEESQRLPTAVRQWIIKNYLPLAFLVAFVVALSWPWPGQQCLRPQVLGVHVLTFVNICLVFFISGLTLRIEELRAALTRHTITGTVFGFLSIVGFTPLLGYAVRLLPLSPTAFVMGMTIFTVVPTTLGVGVSLTDAAKGNVGLAIFLTVASNCLGVLVIPLWLRTILGTQASGYGDLKIDILDIFTKLILSNFIPTVLGKLLRDNCRPVMTFVKRNRVVLTLISNTNLAMLIWQTLSSAREVIVRVEFGNMLLVIATMLAIHLVYLTFNATVVALLRIPPAEATAVVLLASQKSAPVAVTVISYITHSTLEQGLLAVPCVFGQLIQIFVGQPLSQYMKDRNVRAMVEEDLPLTAPLLGESGIEGEVATAPGGASEGNGQVT